jgi:hypothetical protein
LCVRLCSSRGLVLLCSRFLWILPLPPSPFLLCVSFVVREPDRRLQLAALPGLAHTLTHGQWPSQCFHYIPFFAPLFSLVSYNPPYTHTHTGISELFSFFPPPLLCALQSCVVQHGPTKHKGHEATPCWSTRDQRRDRPAPAWCPPNRRERHGVAANLRRYRPPRRPESHEQR